MTVAELCKLHLEEFADSSIDLYRTHTIVCAIMTKAIGGCDVEDIQPEQWAALLEAIQIGDHQTLDARIERCKWIFLIGVMKGRVKPTLYRSWDSFSRSQNGALA